MIQGYPMYTPRFWPWLSWPMIMTEVIPLREPHGGLCAAAQPQEADVLSGRNKIGCPGSKWSSSFCFPDKLEFWGVLSTDTSFLTMYSVILSILIVHANHLGTFHFWGIGIWWPSNGHTTIQVSKGHFTPALGFRRAITCNLLFLYIFFTNDSFIKSSGCNLPRKLGCEKYGFLPSLRLRTACYHMLIPPKEPEVAWF